MAPARIEMELQSSPRGNFDKLKGPRDPQFFLAGTCGKTQVPDFSKGFV